MNDSENLLEDLVDLYRDLRGKVREKWKRDLPLDELLSDRWERAKSLGFGEGSSVYHNSYLYGDVKVGKYTWIGPFTLLDGSGGLEVGDYCSIGSGVHVYTHDAVMWALSGGKAPYDRAPIKIGNCCYIGANAILTKGVQIGDHCLVGAGAFVNKSLPPYSIGVGVPCRVVGKVKVSESGAVSLEYFPPSTLSNAP
jgi:acetyltransferase-like isoleucine patch superfamily enzyme